MPFMYAESSTSSGASSSATKIRGRRTFKKGLEVKQEEVRQSSIFLRFVLTE